MEEKKVLDIPEFIGKSTLILEKVIDKDKYQLFEVAGRVSENIRKYSQEKKYFFVITDKKRTSFLGIWVPYDNVDKQIQKYGFRELEPLTVKCYPAEKKLSPDMKRMFIADAVSYKLG